MKHSKQTTTSHAVTIKKTELIDVVNATELNELVTIPWKATLYFKDNGDTLEFVWKEEKSE